jgi:hypothetical protein
MTDKHSAGGQLQNIFWTAEGDVVIEIAERALILPRIEAEALFVDLGFVLKDMAHSTNVLEVAEAIALDEKETLAELANV